MNEKNKTAEELRRDIEQTRSNMTKTVGAIEQQLPVAIKAKAEETIGEVKTMASDAVAQAKHMASDAVEQAKHAAVEQYHEAKAAVKQEVSEQVREARYAVRRATVGRVETMVHRAGDSMNDAGHSIVDTIRANPIPAALVGLGLTWLFMSGRSQRQVRPAMRSARPHYLDEPVYEAYGYDAYDQDQDDHTGMIDRGRDMVAARVRDGADMVRGGARRVRGVVNEGAHDASAMAHDVRDAVQGAASSARHAAGEFVEHTGESARNLAIRAQREARHLGHEASIRARNAERSAEHMFQVNPLAVGAAAIAVGAMVGLAIPHTDREDELMGSVRDRLIDKGEQLASGAMDKASEVAKEKLSTTTPATNMSTKSNGDRTSIS